MEKEYFKGLKTPKPEILKDVNHLYQKFQEIEKEIEKIQSEGHIIKERNLIIAENNNARQIIDLYRNLMPLIHRLQLNWSKDTTASFKRRFPTSPVEKILEFTTKDRKTGLRFIRFPKDKYSVVGFVKGGIRRNNHD